MVRAGMFAAAVLGAALLVPSFASAQENNNNNGGNRQFDPAQFRERMMNGIKERIGATDDEWKVLQPKIDKVMTAQRNARGGGGGFGGRGGGRRGGGGDNPASTENQSPTSKASSELRTALENKDTPADEIAKKLTALREAREKARAELTAAQKELKEVLTARQEALFVTMGMLD